MQRHSFYLFTLLILIFFYSKLTFAYSVIKFTNTDILINLENESLEIGDELFVLENKRKILLVKVTSVNNIQAKAKILRGNIKELKPNLKLVKRLTNENHAESTISKNHWGILGSFMINSMNAKFTFNGAAQATSMTGNSFGILGFYDYYLNNNFDVRAQGGIEQFNVKQDMSTAVCDNGNSTTCNFNVNFLSGYGIGKYKLTHSNNIIWIGGGLGFLYAISKSSTVLDTTQVTSYQVFTLNLGMDMILTNKKIVPLSMDYVQFPTSATVNANFISLKAGYSF